MIIAPQLSLQTLIMVRIISSILSITINKPIPSTGRPTAARTTESISKPDIGTPVEPIEANIVVAIMIKVSIILKSMPYAWEMKKTVTMAYNDVPSMLMEAPSGRIKLETLLDTPQFLFTEDMVRGRVVTEDEVKQAVNSAPRIIIKCFQGFVLKPKYMIRGNVITAWKARANTTVKKYWPKLENIFNNFGISPEYSATNEAVNDKIPKGSRRMMKFVS